MPWHRKGAPQCDIKNGWMRRIGVLRALGNGLLAMSVIGRPRRAARERDDAMPDQIRPYPLCSRAMFLGSPMADCIEIDTTFQLFKEKVLQVNRLNPPFAAKGEEEALTVAHVHFGSGDLIERWKVHEDWHGACSSDCVRNLVEESDGYLLHLDLKLSPAFVTMSSKKRLTQWTKLELMR